MNPRITLLLFSIIFKEVYSLNILAVFPYHGGTHFKVFRPYLHELAKRGHNVTVVSHFPEKEPVKNYRDIALNGENPFAGGMPVYRTFLKILEMAYLLVTFGTKDCENLYENKDVQMFGKSNGTVDVVIMEMFQSDCALGLAYKFGAPVVGITSHGMLPWHYEMFGIPFNPSYMPNLFFEYGTKPTYFQRLQVTFTDMFFRILYKYYSQPINQNTVAKYIDNVPPLEQLSRNINVLLVYQHFVLTGSKVTSANIIEVNGYHVSESKPLDGKLKKFVEESEHGVIYISFGTILKGATMPKDKFLSIVEAISELPQRVIWKWDEETLPGNPKNVYVTKWIPQNDLLGHPNVVAFFSHCGMLSTTEAIYHGVPVIAMPIFGDQPANAAAVEESGLGVHLPLKDLTKETLSEKFKTVLDPTFRQKVKELSKAWHNRPVSPMDSAVFWTEYVAQHRNINLKNAGVDVPLYQYYCIDIILTFGAILVIPLYIFVKLLQILFKLKKIKLD